MTDDLTDDALFDGRLRLLQPRRGHRAGTDTVLLAAACAAQPGEAVADFGAGSGAAALAVLARVPDTSAVLVEIDPGLAGIAEENIRRNGFADRAGAMVADVAALARRGGPVCGPVDHVIANPPFHPPGGRRSPHDAVARARMDVPGLLDEWMRAAVRILRPGGGLALIHRPDALAGVLAALAGRFGGAVMTPVHARADRPAVRILVTARRGSRAPLAIAPPLMLADAGGVFLQRAAALHRDLAAL